MTGMGSSSASPSGWQESLDRLPIGFGIFDPDHKMLSCNCVFREYRDYPQDLCQPGVTIESLLHHSARRGDFGPGAPEILVAERLVEIHDTDGRSVEREMPDGRFLKIRYQKLDDGGLLVTFEDRTAEQRANLALRLSEERYALVAEAAEEALYEWHIKEDQFYASPGLKALFDLDFLDSGLRTWRWDDRIHPDDRATYAAALEAHLSGESVRWACEYRMRGKQGDYRWVLDHGASLRDGKGKAFRMVAALRDITDRVARETALRESEERHSLATEAMSEGLYDWSVQADRLFVSDRLNSIFGFEAGELSSKAWAGRVHEGEVDTYRRAILDHFKGRTARLECEYRIRDKSSNYRWVRDQATALRDVDGRVMRLVGAVNDITEVKQARDEAERSHALFLDAIEAITSGFALFDSDDRIVICNSKYREYFPELSDMVTPGTPFRAIIKSAIERGLFPLAKENPEGFLNKIMEKRADGGSVPREQFMAGGLWLRISDHKTKDGGLVSIYTDVSDLKTREEELRTQSVILTATLENIEQGISMVNDDLEVVAFNRRFLDMMNFPPELFKPGFPMEQAFRYNAERGEYGPGDAEEQVRQRLELSRQFKAHRFERSTGDGEVMEIIGTPVKSGGFVTTYTDITERKKAEQVLRDNEARLREILENSPIGVAVIDDGNDIRYHNRRFAEILKGPGRDLIGQSPEQFWTDRKIRAEAVKVFERDGIVRDLETRYRGLDGSDVWSLTTFVLTEYEGAPARLTWIYDVTEAKANREALVAALQEFNAVLDTIEYGVLFMGPDLRARIINHAFGKIWGISQDFIDGSPTMRELIEYNRDSGLYDVAPDDWDDFLQDRVAAVHQGTVAPMELRRADGKVLQYQCLALPDGGRMLTYFDITELKERETDLSAAKDAAERALQDLLLAQARLVQAEKMASLGQLTAGIAHEIKNPLNFVNNFAKLSVDLLEELAEGLQNQIASLEDEAREDTADLFETLKGNLEKINEHGRRADGIVKNMLLHSREGEGEMQRVDLNALVIEALNLAYHGARAEDPTFNITLDSDLDASVGEIRCYPQELTRVILNLAGNGFYTANKKLALAPKDFEPLLRIVTRALPGEVVIEVEDNGLGIPPAVCEKIFTPFFTTKPAGEGTGLGLSLSYDIIVTQHGGGMTVESIENQGTTFTVTLPLEKSCVGEEAVA